MMFGTIISFLIYCSGLDRLLGVQIWPACSGTSICSTCPVSTSLASRNLLTAADGGGLDAPGHEPSSRERLVRSFLHVATSRIGTGPPGSHLSQWLVWIAVAGRRGI